MSLEGQRYKHYKRYKSVQLPKRSLVSVEWTGNEAGNSRELSLATLQKAVSHSRLSHRVQHIKM